MPFKEDPERLASKDKPTGVPPSPPSDSTSELVYPRGTFPAKFARIQEATCRKIMNAKNKIEFVRALEDARMMIGLAYGEAPHRADLRPAGENSDTSSDPKPAAEGVTPPRTPGAANEDYSDPVDFGPSNYDAPDDFEAADKEEEAAAQAEEEEAEAFDRQPTPRP